MNISKSKKIRGLGRRQKQIDKWYNSNQDIDLDILKSYKYCYAKANMEPWGNLFNSNSIPSGYRFQIVEKLLNIYYNWKEQLSSNYKEYYLKIWLFYPDFTKSQVVAGIDERIEFYNNTFSNPKRIDFENIKFPNFQYIARGKSINWKVADDIEYFLESDLIERISENQICYIGNKNFARQVINSNKFEITSAGEKVYQKKIGKVWIGGD